MISTSSSRTVRTGIHDHLTWAVIGTWGGYEDDHIFRREEDRAVEVRVERCEPGHVINLERDAIHDVHAPAGEPSAALHVYRGALFDLPRHQWDPTEASVDDASVLEHYVADLRASKLLIEQQ